MSKAGRIKKIVVIILSICIIFALCPMVPVRADSVKEVPIYRLYNPNSGEHFYTPDRNEKNNLVTAGWTYEGVGWYAPKTSDYPVYRLYNPNSHDAGSHHYTMSKAERDHLVSLGWKDEGLAFYAYSMTDKGHVSIWRSYNKNDGGHNYTTDKTEYDKIGAMGWQSEGIGMVAAKTGSAYYEGDVEACKHEIITDANGNRKCKYCNASESMIIDDEHNWDYHYKTDPVLIKPAETHMDYTYGPVWREAVQVQHYVWNKKEYESSGDIINTFQTEYLDKGIDNQKLIWYEYDRYEPIGELTDDSDKIIASKEVTDKQAVYNTHYLDYKVCKDCGMKVYYKWNTKTVTINHPEEHWMSFEWASKKIDKGTGYPFNYYTEYKKQLIIMAGGGDDREWETFADMWADHYFGNYGTINRTIDETKKEGPDFVLNPYYYTKPATKEVITVYTDQYEVY